MGNQITAQEDRRGASRGALRTLASCALVCVFAGSVAAKLGVAGLTPINSVGGTLAVSVALVECGLLVLIARVTTRTWGLRAARVFFWCAAVYVFLRMGLQLPPCGCFGRWVSLQPEMQIVVIIACLGLVEAASARRRGESDANSNKERPSQ